jgi:hypothetical protein
VPRTDDLPADVRGPHAFTLLGAAPQDELPTGERDRIALALRRHLDHD